MPEEQQMQPRQVAFKVRIQDLMNGQYIEQEGWQPNYIVVGDKQVSRANIIAGVIDKQIGESLSTITIDDGSGNIQIRAFNEESFKLRDIEIGDVVIVIGRPRKSANQYFISYEIVKKVDPLWAKVRLKELESSFGKNLHQENTISEKNVHEEISTSVETNIPQPAQVETATVQEENNPPKLEENSSGDEYEERKKILDLIKNSDDGNGAELEGVILNSGLDRDKAENIIQDLIKAGEIYENIAGRIKLL